jgi:hypothetical protein
VIGIVPWNQGDLVLRGGGLAADKLRPGFSQQPSHCHVVYRDQRGQAADACVPGTVRQLRHQLSAKSPALPLVHNGDGDFGGQRVLRGLDVPGDSHAAPVGVIQCAERLVVVVVDIGEVAQLRGRQFPFLPSETASGGI